MLEKHRGNGMSRSGLVFRDGHQAFSRFGVFHWRFDKANGLLDSRQGSSVPERFSDWVWGLMSAWERVFQSFKECRHFTSIKVCTSPTKTSLSSRISAALSAISVEDPDTGE